MAELYRYFDSNIDDIREYTADEFSEYFRMVLTSGIYNGGTNLQVTALGTGMNVNVGDGYALINGYMYKVEGGVELPIATADTTYNRIDRVVIRWDISEEARYIKAFVLTGTPSENPVAPEITREGNIYELSLAQVLVPSGRNFIEGGNITDERLNTEVCGIMNSRIQADTTEIFRQFNDWFTAKTPQFEQQWQTWFSNKSSSATSDVASFDQWLAAKKQEFESAWNKWFYEQTTEGSVTNQQFREHEESEIHIKVSTSMPVTQAVGGIWFQVGDNVDYSEPSVNSVVIKNATVSDNEPATNEDIWIDI